MINLSYEQEEAVTTKDSKVVVVAGSGSGKAQPVDTEIPTPSGWRKLGEIQVGDYVYDRYGKPTKVLGVFPQGVIPCYKITFSDERFTYCGGEHLWTCYRKDKNESIETLTVYEMLSLGLFCKDGLRFSVPVCEPVTAAFNSRHKISFNKELYSGQKTWEDFINEIKDSYKDIIFLSVDERRKFFYWIIKNTNIKVSFPSILADVCCFFNSETEFNLFRELCFSLGYLTSYVVSVENGIKEYYIYVKIPKKEKKNYIRNFFKNKFFAPSEEKKNFMKKKKYCPPEKSMIISIEEVEPCEMVCIYVNNEEHLYLTNDYIVTHNTRVISERINHLLSTGVEPENIYAITFTNNAAQEMMERVNNKHVNISTIHSLAAKILGMNKIPIKDIIEQENFSELFNKIKNNKIVFPRIQHLLVDEFQDVGDKEFEFMLHDLKPENYFVVGDTRQCQPAGTKIKLRNNIEKKIEDIKVGDSVVWYDNSKSFISGPSTKAWNAIEKKVEKISCRDFVNDNLITIKTENGNMSKYTPNHITFVKLNKSDYCHAVYLMCDKNYRFRIGKIPFFSNNKNHSNPWRDKMNAEGCCKIWILKVFKTDKEARVLETKLSYKYQIPQTCWQLDKVRWTKEDLEYIYEGLDTKKSAIACLKEFKRDINFPLIDNEDNNHSQKHFALNAVTEIYACNLMPEVMSCLVYNPDLKHRKQYEIIKEVDFNYIKNPIKVYSLQVEGETYVADNIVTHNCIYSFKGSNFKLFLKLTQQSDVSVYELIDNYRTPKNIVKFANNFIVGMTDIYLTEVNCIKKYLGVLEKKDFSLDNLLQEINSTKTNYRDWFILCRTNREVDEILNFLTKQNIPCDTFKKGNKDLKELKQIIESNTVKVLTVHSAKGLENKNVAVIGVKPYSPEERRLCYVAATRAEEKLIWYNKKKKVKNKMVRW